MTWIKICGITSYDDAMAASRLGVDALGFNFYRGSARYIAPEAAREIIKALPAHIEKIGVFVDEVDARVREVMEICGLDLLQFHGDEPPSYCRKFAGQFVKVLRVASEEDLRPLGQYIEAGPKDKRFLLDSRRDEGYGGTGESFDWELARRARREGDLVLSGGLTPKNIKVALAKVRPFGVDVASGVELRPHRTPGKKDKDLLKQFVQMVRQWDKSQKR